MLSKMQYPILSYLWRSWSRLQLAASPPCRSHAEAQVPLWLVVSRPGRGPVLCWRWAGEVGGSEWCGGDGRLGVGGVVEVLGRWRGAGGWVGLFRCQCAPPARRAASRAKQDRFVELQYCLISEVGMQSWRRLRSRPDYGFELTAPPRAALAACPAVCPAHGADRA